MEKLSIEDLLLIISDRENEEKQANDAFYQLYRRYSQILLDSINSVLNKRGISNNELSQATLNNVFIEINEKPLNFNYDSTKSKSEDTAFRSWIYRIALNELNDLTRSSMNFLKVHSLIEESEDYDKFIEINLEEEFLSDNRKLLDQALSGLSVRDKAILLTYFEYHEEGKNAPTHVLDEMCKYWGTTKDNARQIKKRSLKKVIEKLEQLSTLKTI